MDLRYTLEVEVSRYRARCMQDAGQELSSKDYWIVKLGYCWYYNSGATERDMGGKNSKCCMQSLCLKSIIVYTYKFSHNKGKHDVLQTCIN